jgi:hypothetical protein
MTVRADTRLFVYREPGFPAGVAESTRTQSNKLGAIEIPPDQDRPSRDSIRRAIDESFVAGFRMVMVIGPTLAVGSALTAMIFIGAPKQSSSV